MAKSKGNQNRYNPIEEGVQEGLRSILETHPTMRYHQQYVANHIDVRSIAEKKDELLQEAQYRNMSREETIEYVKDGVADYVAAGQAFDEEAKETILNSSLEEKAKSSFFTSGISRYKARRELKGQRYFDGTVEAFQSLSSLLSSENYSKRMPELAKAVNTINDMGFLAPALEVLKYHGIIDKGKYSMLKNLIRERVEKAKSQAAESVEKYISKEEKDEEKIGESKEAEKISLAPQKIAAGILAFIGAGILIAKSSLTGAAIGAAARAGLPILGMILLCISFFIYMHSRKNLATFKN